MSQSLARLDQLLTKLEQDGAAGAIFNEDGVWWSDHTAEQVSNGDLLGWLSSAQRMQTEAADIIAFANEIRDAGFENVVMLGVGGGSLAADLVSTDFETAAGYPEVWALDSTDPAVVSLVRDNLDLKKTLFVVVAAGELPVETAALFSYFWGLVSKSRGERAGDHFAAITRSGSPLLDLAQERHFRRVFAASGIAGGAFTALDYFGLVPAALMGVDINRLLDNALAMHARLSADGPVVDNPALWLAAALAAWNEEGRNKLTFLLSEGLVTFGDWLEQLVARSTGKEGKGIVPVLGERVGPPESYDGDRAFVYLRLADADNEYLDNAARTLIGADFPLITLPLMDAYDLGGEFFRWELALAVAARLMGTDPFSEPDVAQARDNTRALLAKARLPEAVPDTDEGALEVYAGGVSSDDDSIAGYLRALLGKLESGGYFTILAYLDPSEENEAVLQAIRLQVREEYQVATTLGFGPRYLHLTDQLHKGGPAGGVFLLLTADEGAEVRISELGYSFGTLIRAQALGEFASLVAQNRAVLRLHMYNAEEGLPQLGSVFNDLLGQATDAEYRVPSAGQ